MSSFDDREKAQEAKFARDAELTFKIEARRNKLLGLWAAELMARADADAYAREVIAADFEEAGDEDVFRKIAGDLKNAGSSVSEAEIRSKMQELLATAEQQLKA